MSERALAGAVILDKKIEPEVDNGEDGRDNTNLQEEPGPNYTFTPAGFDRLIKKITPILQGEQD